MIARRLTAPATGRRFTTGVHGFADEAGRTLVLLDDTVQTRQRGRYGAYLPNGDYVRFGDEPFRRGRFIGRAVDEDDARRLAAVENVSWTGICFPSPAAAGLSALDVLVNTRLGPTPAWLFPGRQRDLWAVHVHGMGSTRAGTLRGVQVADELGLTSLVTTYRNTIEGIHHGSGRSTLGFDEADDVAAALEHAVQQGARRVVLFGWSMGAALALRVAHSPRWRGLVTGVVADSPVLDWRSTLAANLTQAGSPAWVARLAEPWLSGPLARVAGLDHRIDLNGLDWTQPGRITTPLLVLQGTADRSTPWQTAAAVAATSPCVDLELFAADHTTTWNSDPDRWRLTTTEWLRQRLATVA